MWTCTVEKGTGETVHSRPGADVRFRTIYDNNFEAMRSYCLRRVPVSDVNDVLSDLFLVVWRRIDELPQGDETRLWPYGTARHVIANSERSRRRANRLFAKAIGRKEPEAPDPETIMLESDLAGEVMSAMKKLRPADPPPVCVGGTSLGGHRQRRRPIGGSSRHSPVTYSQEPPSFPRCSSAHINRPSPSRTRR